MKIPSPSAELVARFQKTVPNGEGIELKKVFGQPSAFVTGNMFYGVFGDQMFVRLSEPDRAEMVRSEGARPFEPMPGRAMSEYLTVPKALLADESLLKRWISRSVSYARGLPKKAPKTKARTRQG